MSILRRFSPSCLFYLGCVLMLLGAAGCAHYRPASSDALPFKTLYIPPVKNHAYVPQVQTPLTDNLVKAFLRDGSVKIVPEDQADATLKVVVTDYRRSIFATQSDDTARARSFTISLKAKIKLSDNRTGKVYLKSRDLTADETTFSEDDQGSTLPQAEYQTMPILTRKLAETILNAVLDVW